MWGALINGASALGSAYLNNQASQNAANQQQQASAAAAAAASNAATANNDTTKAIYDQTRSDNLPRIQAGQAATNQLYNAMQDGTLTRRFTLDDFQADPGYQAALDAGLRQRNQQAAARGAYLDPATNKLLEKYGVDMANQQFASRESQFNADRTDAYNKIAGIAGVGQTASNASASAGNNYVTNTSANNNNVANATTTAAANNANAQAALGINQANTNSNLLNNALGGAYSYYQTPSGTKAANSW